jgi:branched-chain amino acid transport system ATP-binding protein
MAHLEIENLQTGYGETMVIRDVSLSVDEGEVCALLGRNGVGKTTTLRAILGLVPPWRGTIRFDGDDVTDLSTDETVRRGVGVVPEERRIFPGLTVEENLRLSTYSGSTSAHRRSVDEVLDTFEQLGERRDSLGNHLSGGEQQMLAIARALVAGADLLLLDEPTEGLAPLIVDRVTDLVADVNDHGITVLLVEQNAAVALDLADRVAVLDHGEIVYENDATELSADSEVLDQYLGVTVDE